MGVTEILCNFRLVLDGKTGKKNTYVIKIWVLRKVLANNFALSDAVNYSSSGTANLLLFGTLLATQLKSQEPRLWEVMDSFVL